MRDEPALKRLYLSFFVVYMVKGSVTYSPVKSPEKFRINQKINDFFSGLPAFSKVSAQKKEKSIFRKLNL